jgi:hypothetical protein
MTTVLRIGLELSSIATVAMAGWLAAIVLSVLPERDPGHVQLWAAVTVATVGLAAVTFLAIRRGAAMPAGLAAVLAILCVAAIGFGMLVLVSELTTVAAGDSEGYLLVIGAILTAEGSLGLAWLSAVLAGRRR